MTTTRSGSCVRSRDKRAMTQIRRSYPIVELFSVVGLVIHDSIKKTKKTKNKLGLNRVDVAPLLIGSALVLKRQLPVHRIKSSFVSIIFKGRWVGRWRWWWCWFCRCSATANSFGIGAEASITRPSNHWLGFVSIFLKGRWVGRWRWWWCWFCRCSATANSFGIGVEASMVVLVGWGVVGGGSFLRGSHATSICSH